MLEEQALQKVVNQRYAGWASSLGQQILLGQTSLADLAQRVETQESIHNLFRVNKNIWKTSLITIFSVNES